MTYDSIYFYFFNVFSTEKDFRIFLQSSIFAAFVSEKLKSNPIRTYELIVFAVH